MKPKAIGMLFLAAAALLAFAYALIEGELWPAAACAFSAVVCLIVYRDKRGLDRQS
jgi:hypothetical protein